MGRPGCLRPDALERNSQEFWSFENPHPNLAQNARLGWGTRLRYCLRPDGLEETPKSFGLRKIPTLTSHRTRA
jgi:hypothetical protein